VALDAVIFDMDGLMLDTEPLYKAAWQQATAELGFVLDDECYANLIGLREEESEDELLKRFGEQFPLENFRRRWPAAFHARIEAGGIPVKPGLAELLDFVAARQLPCAIATSSHRGYADVSLRRAGLEGRFDVIVTGEVVARAKPAPDIYLEAARRLGAEPARCAALEDSDLGVLSARAAGMIPIAVPDLKPLSPTAAAAAFRIVKTLHDARRVLSELME
jgi:HAD superfamily hydrolase (TIGR01509 family)